VESLASLVPKNEEGREGGLAPLKLYESMSSGVPIVASDAPGLAQTIAEAECGILVPAGDAAALADAVNTLAADPGAASVMGRRGRDYAVANASWRSRAADTSALIAKTLASSATRAV
jgi:glycosyltransferase involved in cell wall biosynthesis